MGGLRRLASALHDAIGARLAVVSQAAAGTPAMAARARQQIQTNGLGKHAQRRFQSTGGGGGDKPKLLNHKPPKSQRKVVSGSEVLSKASRGTNSKTKWLLHPRVPVDVRAAGAVVAALSGLYLYSGGGETPDVSTSRPPATSRRSEDSSGAGDDGDTLSAVVGREETTDVATDLSPKMSEASENLEREAESSFREMQLDREAMTLDEAIAPPTEAAATEEKPAAVEEEEEEEEPTVAVAAETSEPEAAGVDREGSEAADADGEAELSPEEAKQAELVANLLQDVLTGRVIEEAQTGPTAEAEPVAEAEPIVEAEPVVEASPMAEAEEEGAEAEEAAAVALESSALPDDVPSRWQEEEEEVSVVAVPEGLVVDEGASEAPLEPEPSVSEGEAPQPVARQRHHLDPREIGDKVDAQSLVSGAVAKGEDPGENWELYGAMHRQAAHDADVFNVILMDLVSQYEEEIEDLLDDLNRLETDKASLQSDMSDLEARHKQDLEAEFARGEVRKLEAMKQQMEEYLRTTAKAMVRERQIRLGQLDEVRTKLNSLKMAFSKRSGEAKLSHDSHKLTQAVLSIKCKTDEGLPFADALDMLGPLAKDDELIALVVDSIPPQVAREGAMTSTQLQQWFWEVERDAARVALLPSDGHGPLSTMLSHLASFVRVREDASSEYASVGSVESALRAARGLVSEGKFYECATLLEKVFGSTAAKAVIGEWIEAARNRARIDQAVMVLEASATTKAKSLS